MRRTLRHAALGCLTLGLALAGSAHSQSWPTKPVRLVVPFAAGGGTDAFARPASARLSQVLGQQFIIDNRAGAGGTIGADIAAKSAPDGYTFLVGAVHHTIAVSLYRKLPYDLERDLVPVTMLAQVPNVVVVHPSLAVKSLRELIDYGKANPNKLNYGSAGNGTAHHLAGELFRTLTGVQMTHVPYKGAGPAMADLLAGQVVLMFDGMGTSSAQIRGGKLRPLAVAASERMAAFPEIPTAREAGLTGFEISTWYGLWAPRGTPREIVAKLQHEVAQLFQANDIKEIWASQAAEMGGNTPEQFTATIKSEIAKWAKVVKDSGAQID